MNKKTPNQSTEYLQCTYAIHGTNYISQKWFYCRTCGLYSSSGCCEACSIICHHGHDVEYHGIEAKSYCDCGAGDGKFPCKCLQPIKIGENNH